MKIAILGFAGQGQAAWEYWNKPGNEITVCDRHKDTKVPEGAHTHLGESYLHGLEKFDLLVRTPALHPDEIVKANPKHPDILKKVTTVTNEFLKVCPSKNIIGVTGTKGKGTTSTLIAKMLEASGRRVHLGGNIGIPPLNMLKDDIQPDDWVVLELANFQLIDIKHSPHIAVCLMVVPEHMDWHADMEEYVTAKQQLFIHQKSDDIAIYYAENPDSLKVVSAGAGWQIPYFAVPGAVVRGSEIVIEDTVVCSVADVKLLGTHNLQNVCAAITAFWQVAQDPAAICGVVRMFTGLEHRLEFVREVEKVKYYNDSFAATPEAAAAAIDAIPGKKVLIIGGHDRQLNLDNLAKAITDHADEIRTVLIIGASGERAAKDLKAAGAKNVKVTHAKSMETVVQKAQDEAKPGDTVVLSPGFPSFDMFKNFEDRGLQFKEQVNSL